MSVTTNPTAKAEPARGVQLTETAAKEIRRVIAEQNMPETVHVRIGAKGGGKGRRMSRF